MNLKVSILVLFGCLEINDDNLPFVVLSQHRVAATGNNLERAPKTQAQVSFPAGPKGKVREERSKWEGETRGGKSSLAIGLSSHRISFRQSIFPIEDCVMQFAPGRSSLSEWRWT